MKSFKDYLSEVEVEKGPFEPVAENASCGATSAASVASAVTPFFSSDGSGDWGVYEANRTKSKKSKVTLLKR